MHKSMKKWGVPLLLVLAILIAGIVALVTVTGSADPEPKDEIDDFGVQALSSLDLAGDATTDLRLLFTVGEVDYESAGFVLSKTVFNPTVGCEGCYKYETDTVHSAVRADGNLITADPGRYWVAVKLTNVPRSYFDSPIYVRAFVKDGEGIRYSEPKEMTVCWAKDHTHTVTGVYETKAATLLSPEMHVGTCSVCGLTNVVQYVGSKNTGIVADSTAASAPDGLGSGSNFYLGKYAYSDIPGEAHFYPTEANLSGNDLLIEYSVLWNSTMTKSNGSSSVLDVGRFDREGNDDVRKGFEMACRDELGSQWCKYVGGFEGYGVVNNNGTNDVSIEYGPVGSNGADEELFPYIGDYGWHRLGVRIHEDAYYDSGVVYRITISLYIDGEKALQYVAKSWDPDNDAQLDLLLYKAELVDDHLEYSDNVAVAAVDNYAYAVYFANFYNHANKMYLVVDDVYVTCGREFVQQVKPVEDPAAGPTLTLGGEQYDARFFYEEGHSPDMYTYRSSQKYADGLTADSGDSKYILSIDKMTYETLRGDKNFYDDGNDVLVEFSMLWDERFTYGNTCSGVLGMGKVWNKNLQKQRKGMEMALWDLISSSQDCWYAGGFEGFGVEKPYTYGPSSAEGGITDFAYVGDYGWHRIGVRMHEEYEIEDDDPVYLVTLTLYVDGVKVLSYDAYSNTGENNGGNWEDYGLLFYTVEKEGGVWTPKNHDTDGTGNALTISPVEIAGYFNETGENARFFTVADVYATVGSNFVMNVIPVENPAPRTESVGNLDIPGSYYFTEVIPHSHEWDGEYTEVVKATLTDVGTRTEHCSICGQAHGVIAGEAEQHDNLDVKGWPDGGDGDQYRDGYNIYEEVQKHGTKHFYPTDANPDGNDLLVEYSVLWNETFENLVIEDGNFDSCVVTKIGNSTAGDANNFVWWSLANDDPGSWCQFAGGFEACFATDYSDGSKYTPEGMTDEGGTYADYPNIGGSNSSNPEYGWHRIGIRIHQEVTNEARYLAGTDGYVVYKLTITTYIDGVAVSRLFVENQAGTGGMPGEKNLLYVVTGKSGGKLKYNDINRSDADKGRYVWLYFINNKTKASDGDVCWAAADAYVTCGSEFVQNVTRVDTPTSRNETVSDTKSGVSATLPAAYYYKLEEKDDANDDVRIWDNSHVNSENYAKKFKIDTEVLDGAHFYPTAGNPDGNDLLMEYSILWNESMLLLEDGTVSKKNYRPWIVSCIANETKGNDTDIVWWSPTDSNPSSGCTHAGGFEYAHATLIDDGSEIGAVTPAGINQDGGVYADYPNIGGTVEGHPEYGWHRVAIRYHEEVITYGATPTYKVVFTTYIDGVGVSELYKTGTASEMCASGANLLFTVSDTDNGGEYYNGHYYKDLASDRYVFPFYLNDIRAASGKKVFFAIADVYATAGHDFAMRVERSDAPTTSIYALPATTSTYANDMYFKVVD